MIPDSLLENVTITRDRTVLLGKTLACDGFDQTCAIGAISHAHKDHTEGLHSSLHSYNAIFVSEPTRSLLIASEGRWLERRTNLVALPLRKRVKCNGQRVVLYPANHILGSVKILLERADGTRILYTGDFKMPQRPIQSDIVVTEATYGDPNSVRRFGREFPENQLIRLVRRRIASGPIQIHATQGKLQDVMRLLRRHDIQVPFLMSKNIWAWSKVYEQYGEQLGEFLRIESQEAAEIQRSRGDYILFFTLGSKMLNFNKYFCIKVSGREPSIPFQQITDKYYSVTLSDHADLSELLQFIKGTGARIVITDGSRCGLASKLAQEIKRTLKKDAYPMPV